MAGVPGALRSLLQRPYGLPVIWAVASGLLGLGLWRIGRAAGRRRKAFWRIGEAAAGAGHLALAWSAWRVALRMGGRETGAARLSIGWLIQYPAGRLALRVAAVAVIASAAASIVRGLTGRIPAGLNPKGLPGRVRTAVVRAGRFGLVAKGVVLSIIGYYLLQAVAELDPGEFREIGGSLRVLSRPPFGPMMLGAVALGLIIYGAFLWVLALSDRPE